MFRRKSSSSSVAGEGESPGQLAMRSDFPLKVRVLKACSGENAIALGDILTIFCLREDVYVNAFDSKKRKLAIPLSTQAPFILVPLDPQSEVKHWDKLLKSDFGIRRPYSLAECLKFPLPVAVALLFDVKDRSPASSDVLILQNIEQQKHLIATASQGSLEAVQQDAIFSIPLTLNILLSVVPKEEADHEYECLWPLHDDVVYAPIGGQINVPSQNTLNRKLSTKAKRPSASSSDAPPRRSSVSEANRERPFSNMVGVEKLKLRAASNVDFQSPPASLQPSPVTPLPSPSNTNPFYPSPLPSPSNPAPPPLGNVLAAPYGQVTRTQLAAAKDEAPPEYDTDSLAPGYESIGPVNNPAVPTYVPFAAHLKDHVEPLYQSTVDLSLSEQEPVYHDAYLLPTALCSTDPHFYENLKWFEEVNNIPPKDRISTIADIAAQYKKLTIAEFTMDDVKRMLEDLHLEQYVSIFLQEQIDGHTLPLLDSDMLQNDLHMKSRLHQAKILNFINLLKDQRTHYA